MVSRQKTICPLRRRSSEANAAEMGSHNVMLPSERGEGHMTQTVTSGLPDTADAAPTQ